MASKKPKTLTPLQKEYNKELRRIKRLVNSFKKRGYFFNETEQEKINKILDKGFVSSKNKPKVSSKTVQQLKNKTPEYFYKHSEYIDTKTGEVISGESGRARRRSKEHQKEHFTQKKLEKVKDIIDHYLDEPQEGNDYLNEDEEDYTELTEKEKKKIQEIVDERIKEREKEDKRKQYYEDEERRKQKGDDKNIPNEADNVIENLSDELHKWTPSDLPNSERDVLGEVNNELENFNPPGYWHSQGKKGDITFADIKEREKGKLERILDGAIRSQGRDVVAKRLQDNADEITHLVQEILYASGSKEGNFKDGRTQVNEDIARFSAIIMGRSLTITESEEITDYAEEFEIEN